MEKEKYKIVLDTNFVYLDEQNNLDRCFNYTIAEIKEFIKKYNLNNISIVMPEIVFWERIKQRLNEIRRIVEKIDLLFKKLIPFSVKIDKEKYSDKDYEKKLVKTNKKFLEQNDVIIIKNIKINQSQLIDRAINYIKPFSKGDKGFKDTIIWLSILENAKKNEDINYIFCTKNAKDYNEEFLIKEFKQYSKKEFKIISDIVELKEHLDKKLKLKLKLVELHKEIEEEIKEELKEKTGTIVTGVSSFLQSDSLFASEAGMKPFSYYDSHRFFSKSLLESKEEPIRFDFKDIDINNIVEEADKNYVVDLSLFVEKINSDDYKKETIRYSMQPGISWKEEIKLNVSLNYNRSNKNIKILSVTKGIDWNFHH